jgi:hypothetical protein
MEISHESAEKDLALVPATPQREDHVIRAGNHFTPCGARRRDLWLIGPSL